MGIKAVVVKKDKSKKLCKENECYLPKLTGMTKCLKHYKGRDILLKYAKKIYQFIGMKCPGQDICIYACRNPNKGGICVEDYNVFVDTILGYREIINERNIPIDQYLCDRIGDMAVKRMILIRGWRKLHYESTQNSPDGHNLSITDWRGVMTVLDRIQESLRRDLKELEITPEGRRKTKTDDNKSEGYKSMAECISDLMKQEPVRQAIKLATGI